MEAINLCRKPGGCCPILKQEGNNFVIFDKDQNKKGEVILTKEQLKILLKEVGKRVN